MGGSAKGCLFRSQLAPPAWLDPGRNASGFAEILFLRFQIMKPSHRVLDLRNDILSIVDETSVVLDGSFELPYTPFELLDLAIHLMNPRGGSY